LRDSSTRSSLWHQVETSDKPWAPVTATPRK